jgi:hypothetical protein
VRITAPEDKPWARVEMRSSADDRDPALLVDVEMSALSVPELAFVQITDPRRPRYAIDRDPDGRDTLFGVTSRNVAEELRAMKDGLAPGQVRQGLRLLARVLEAMDGFCRLIGWELYLIEPLFTRPFFTSAAAAAISSAATSWRESMPASPMGVRCGRPWTAPRRFASPVPS